LLFSRFLATELIRAYLAGVSCVSIRQNTPLHEACKHRVSSAVVELLISKYPDALQQRNAKGKLPIDLALAHGAKKNFVALLEKAKL
jgi:ankyrin repeat protein